ncbi:ABC transporter ATP-binding protein [Paenibacillus sp. RC67]|uniref:ABC transporter ATP-binding protein n=1 Tax=Paenibacillus sp. RC67 TaxID=3039392 RepID=UPI0024ADDD34|nr:ABC transporter ATP-binding protein [Paenibacillus sp. RC67]
MDTFQRYVAAQLNEHAQQRFHDLFYKKALTLGLEWFESPRYFHLLQRCSKAMESGSVSNQLAQIQRFVTLTISCTSILWLFAVQSKLLSALLLCCGVGIVMLRISNSQELKQMDDRTDTFRRKAVYIKDLLVGRNAAAEIRIFALGQHFIDSWRERSVKLIMLISSISRRHVVRSIPLSLASAVVHGFIMIYLIREAAQNQITTGTMVAMLFAAHQYLEKIQMISWRVQGISRFFSELIHIPLFLQLEGEEVITAIKEAPERLERIQFRQVCFAYPGQQRHVITNLNLDICPGDRIAIVGENGAGKSTLTKLLLGLYKPTVGKITMNGIDVQELQPQEWRSRFGAVFQAFTRYSFSVKDNIGFGKIDRLGDRNAIIDAAHKSSAHHFIETLPDGYETLLGKEFNGGRDLSGGQWQQIAMARAIFRNAEIVVLDEPAAALDASSELEVYRQWLDRAHDKIVIMISHRLGAARLANKVIYLQEGKAVQIGTHDELIALGGPYADLYHLQAVWYQKQEGS